MIGADRDWLAVHGDLIALHVEKSSTYGVSSDRFANFTAVAEVTGQPPERYVLERIHEKTTRALNMIGAGQADEVREYLDLASQGIICEALLRRRKRATAAAKAELDPYDVQTLSARLEDLATLVATVGLGDACGVLGIERAAQARELVDALRMAAEHLPVRAEASC